MTRTQSPHIALKRRPRVPDKESKARHRALSRETAKLIGQPVDSLAVRLTALARLKLEALEAQLLDGDVNVTVADITTLQATFDKYVPKPTMSLDLHVVETLEVQTCPHCQTKYELATVRRTLEESRNAARERDAVEMAHKKAVSALQGSISAPAENNELRTAPSPANVVPIDAEKRAADLRAKARVSNGVDPGPPRPPAPRSTSPLFDSGGDNRSISQFQRDVDAAYRGQW